MSGSFQDTEKRPLLHQDNQQTGGSGGGGGVSASASGVAEDAPSESDDTDSVSTPTDSPSKGRLQSLNVSPLKGEGKSFCTYQI